MISRDNIVFPSPTGKFVTWSESYSIGIPKIDSQHKELLDYANDLYEHASGNKDEEAMYFNLVIQEIVQYVQFHFGNEEKMMIATKFDGYAEHKKEHEQFVLSVIKIIRDYEAGKRLTLEKFAYFLKDWVLSHIAIVDVKYALYFKKIATRKEDGKLSVTAADITINSN